MYGSGLSSEIQKLDGNLTKVMNYLRAVGIISDQYISIFWQVFNLFSWC